MLSFLNSILPIFLMFLPLLQMPVWGTEQFTVLVPTKTIEVLLGIDTTLPCYLLPEMNAEDMEIRWFRSQISETVFMVQNGTAQIREQMKEYIGRTELIKDFITKGWLAVKIYDTQMSDSGEYHCLFKKGNVHQESIFEVKVVEPFSWTLTFLIAIIVLMIIVNLGTVILGIPFKNVNCKERRKKRLLLDEENIHETRESSRSLEPEWQRISRKEESDNQKVNESLLSIHHEPATLKGEIAALKEEIERRKDLYKADWRKASFYADWRKELFQALHVTLDPDTAHPELILSEKWRRVIRGESPQNFSDTTKRFDSLPCVLGREEITSGRFYWEIEVGNRVDWDLGVCRVDVRKKGKVTVAPENGFWALRLYNNEYWALTSPPTHLSLRQSPQKVALFLDYDAGELSFYNMNDGSHIYNFPSVSFCGTLCPFIRLWSNDQTPVNICTGL